MHRIAGRGRPHLGRVFPQTARDGALRLRDRLRRPCQDPRGLAGDAARQCARPYDPLFFEEPIRPENFDAWGELKRGLSCTLATGESLYSRFEFLRLLQVRGADIIQPDICVVGGMLEMRRIAALAEAHFVTVAPHNPMGPLASAVNVHFAASQPNFRILEYRLPHGPGYVFGTGGGEAPSADARLQGAWYVKDPYLPKDGHLELRPDRPGWVVEMDMEVLGQEDYVHWQRKVPVRPDGSSAYV